MAVPLLIQRGIAASQPVDKPSACVKCDEVKDGYAVVFINGNGLGLLKDGHAALFLGRESDKDRILYDPCAYYAKGKGYASINENYPVAKREGPIFEGKEFDYEDYYLYHRSNGPKINAYAFEITKDEEKQIHDRIIDQFDDTCYAECIYFVRAAIEGIGPFKGIGDLTSFTPIDFGIIFKVRTKMSISADKNDVLNRMRGISR